MEIAVIVLASVAVAAIVAAVVAFVRGSMAQADLRHSADLYEEKLKVKDEAAAGLEKNFQAQLKGKDEYIENLNKVHAEAVRKLEEQQAEAVRKMEAQQAEAMKKVAEQHVKDMELMQTQFKVAAGEILKQNTQDFSRSSSEKIDTLLKPVREKFEEFRIKVEESDKGRVEMKTSIEEQVRSIMGQAAKVSASADNLANALTSRSKTQGDFGELILKDILINAGLREGVHFQCQGVMTDENGHEIKSEDGKVMIPDVQVFYPDGTTVIVDSKVSITDYVTYCSETDETLKKAAMNRHIDSIRKHVNELADKDYTSYLSNGKRKVDYNIMFIPNDGAFIAVLEEAPRLWQEARDRNVLIVSQMNLVVVLNMIYMVWRQSEREKNVDAIVAAASELMGQLQTWLVEFDKLGKQIGDLSNAYENSKWRLRDSSQSVMRKVQKLERLGAAPKQKSLKATGRKTAVGAASESIIPASLTPAEDQDVFAPADGGVDPATPSFDREKPSSD